MKPVGIKAVCMLRRDTFRFSLPILSSRWDACSCGCVHCEAFLSLCCNLEDKGTNMNICQRWDETRTEAEALKSTSAFVLSSGGSVCLCVCCHKHVFSSPSSRESTFAFSMPYQCLDPVSPSDPQRYKPCSTFQTSPSARGPPTVPS